MPLIEVDFRASVPPRFSVEIQDQRIYNRIYELIALLVEAARRGFPFAACDVLELDTSSLEQAISAFKQELAAFTKRLAQLTFSSGLPLAFLCEMLDGREAGLTYVLNMIFPDYHIEHHDAVECIRNATPVNALQFVRLRRMNPAVRERAVVPVKIAASTVEFVVSMDEYASCLEQTDAFIQDIVSLLRARGYKIYDEQDSIKGQANSANINLPVMNALLHFQPAVRAICGLNQLFLQNQDIQARSERQQRKRDEVFQRPSQFRQIAPQQDSEAVEYLSNLQNERPLMIGIEENFNYDTEVLLALALVLSSRASPQIVQFSQETTPNDVAQLCFLAGQSYRVFAALNPENLAPASLWWLLHLIPSRIINNETKFQQDIFGAFNTVESSVPPTYTIPIKGQLVIISRLVLRGAQRCQCTCQNQMCANYLVGDDERYTHQPVVYYNNFWTLLTTYSIYVSLLCAIGGCIYANDADYVRSVFKATNRQNAQALSFIIKNTATIADRVAIPAEQSPFELSETIACDGQLQLVFPKAVAGLNLLVTDQVGLLDFAQADCLAVCLNFYNSASFASAIALLYQLNSISALNKKIKACFIGIIAGRIETFAQDNEYLLNYLIAKNAIIHAALCPDCAEHIKYFSYYELAGCQKLKAVLPSNKYHKEANRLEVICKYFNGCNLLEFLFENLCMEHHDVYQFYHILNYATNLMMTAFDFPATGLVLSYLARTGDVERVSYFSRLIFDISQSQFYDVQRTCQQYQELVASLLQLGISTGSYTVRSKVSLLSNYNEINDHYLYPLLNNAPSGGYNSQQQFFDYSEYKFDEGVRQELANINSSYQASVIYLCLNPDYIRNAYNVELMQFYRSCNLPPLYPQEMLRDALLLQFGATVPLATHLLYCKVLMATGWAAKVTDYVLRLVLLNEMQGFRYRTNAKAKGVSYLYNPFSKQFSQFKNVYSGLELVSHFAAYYARYYHYPIYPQYLLIARYSDRQIMTSFDISQYQFENDLYIAIPNNLFVALNLLAVVEINDLTAEIDEDLIQYYGSFGTYMINHILEYLVEYTTALQALGVRPDLLKSCRLKKAFCSLQIFCAERFLKGQLLHSYIQYTSPSRADILINYQKQFISTSFAVQNDFDRIQAFTYTGNEQKIDVEAFYRAYFTNITDMLGIQIFPGSQYKQLYLDVFNVAARDGGFQFEVLSRISIFWCNLCRLYLLGEEKVNDAITQQIVIGLLRFISFVITAKLPEIDAIDITNGYLISSLITDDAFDIITQQSFKFMDAQLLKIPDAAQFAIYLLKVVTGITCNLQMVFETVSQCDFFARILNIQVRRRFAAYSLCDACAATGHDSHRDFYADFNANHVFSREKIAYFVVARSRGPLCDTCRKGISGRFTRPSLLIEDCDAANLKLLLHMQEYNAKSALQLINLTRLLNETTIGKTSKMPLIALLRGEDFLAALAEISQNQMKISIEDRFCVLAGVRGLPFIPAFKREEALLQNLEPKHISALLEKAYKNELFALVHDNADDAQKRLFFLLLDKRLSGFVVRQFVKPEAENIPLAQPKQLYDNFIDFAVQIENPISYSLSQILEMAQKQYFWLDKTEQVVQCVLGANINVIWISGQFSDEDKQNITNEVYSVLNHKQIKSQKWFYVDSPVQITYPDVSYVSQITVAAHTNMSTYFYFLLDQIIIFSPGYICLLIYAQENLPFYLYLDFYKNIAFYNVHVEAGFYFKYLEQLQLYAIQKWDQFDQQLWINLLNTNQSTFKDFEKAYYYEVRITLEDYYEIIKKMKIQQMNKDAFFSLLLRYFSGPVIEHFKGFIISQESKVSLLKWRDYYGGLAYLRYATPETIQYNLQNIDVIWEISRYYLEFSNLNMHMVYFQQFKLGGKLFDGSTPRLHPILTAYLSYESQQQYKSDIVHLLRTVKIPQLYPEQLIGAQMALFMSKYAANLVLYRAEIEKIMAPMLYEQYYYTFLYFYSLSGRVFDAENLAFIVIAKNDAKIDRNKIAINVKKLFDFIANCNKVYCGIERPDVVDNVLFYFDNQQIISYICAILHSTYKSEVLTHVSNLLQNSTQNCETLDALQIHLKNKCEQFAFDYFSQNWNFSLYFVRQVLLHAAQYTERYWVTLAFYLGCFRSYKLSRDVAVEQPKNVEFTSIFRECRQPKSFVLDVLCNPVFIAKTDVFRELFRHFIAYGEFSKDRIKDETIALLQIYEADHPSVVQKYSEQSGETIFDLVDIVRDDFSLEITSLELLQTIIKGYYSYVMAEFEHQKNYLMLEEIFNCRLNTLKLKFNYERINKHIPKTYEYFSERHVTKLIDQMYDHLLGTLLATFFADIPSSIVSNLRQMFKRFDQVYYVFFEIFKRYQNIQAACQALLDSHTVEEVMPYIHVVAKYHLLNTQSNEIPNYCQCHFANSEKYYEYRQNATFTQGTAAALLAQKSVLEGKLAPYFLRSLDDIGNSKFKDMTLKRTTLLMGKFQKTLEPFIQYIQLATAAFLIDLGPGISFYELLADNHDDCLGLWMPGHVFESKLGIVHADCGLKDSRFENMNPTEIHVRRLSPTTTRLIWILSFSCILFSLNCNPMTLQTDASRSILSDETLLGVPRDLYCVGVIQTSAALLAQLRGAFYYEVLLLYQQFLYQLTILIKKSTDMTLKAPKTVDSRDRMEQILSDATAQAETLVPQIIQRFDKRSGAQAMPTNVAKIYLYKEGNAILKLLKMSRDPHETCALLNAGSLAARLRRVLENLKDLKPEDAISEVAERHPRYGISAKYDQFLSAYNRIRGKVQIGGGCQDNELPLLTKDAAVGYLVSEELNDFAILREVEHVVEQFAVVVPVEWNFVVGDQLGVNAVVGID